MKKIVYRNLTFKGGEPFITAIDNCDDSVIDNWVFNNCHRYMGNHILGHGVGDYEVYETNREINNNLEYELSYHLLQISSHQKDVDRINKILKEPLVEKFLYKKSIGSLPTKEELLKEGWEEAQIDEAFKEIKL